MLQFKLFDFWIIHHKNPYEFIGAAKSDGICSSSGREYFKSLTNDENDDFEVQD